MMGIEDHNHEHHGFTDELKEKLSEGADDEVRGQLLVEAVAEQEKIEVGDADLDERIGRMADMRGGAVKPAKLRAELDKAGQLDSLRLQIRHEKALDLLISKATVTEKAPEPEKTESDSGDE
jgi:trigger factor